MLLLDTAELQDVVFPKSKDKDGKADKGKFGLVLNSFVLYPDILNDLSQF